MVNADGYKCLVQSGETKIGLLHFSNRYKLSIVVLDASGKTMVCLSILNTAGVMNYEIDATHLSNGVYFVKLSEGTQSQQIRFVKNGVRSDFFIRMKE